MIFHVLYTLKHSDGTIKRFDEYWKTQRQPTKQIVESNWNFVYSNTKVIDMFFVCEAKLDHKVVVSMEV